MAKQPSTQSLIITAPRGVDIMSYAKSTYVQPGDQELYIIEHKKETGTKTGIFIEDIRDLQLNVRTSRQGKRTLVFIYDASSMTRQAQAAILKTLEEPRENLYILLLTHSPQSLTDTILSRCHVEHVSHKLAKSSDPQILFMARGSQDEVNRLESDQSYRRDKLALYELAKQFVGANAYARITITSSLQSKPREDVIQFIDAVTHITSILLKSKPTSQMLTRAKTLLEVGEALRENGNIRTQLLRIVV